MNSMEAPTFARDGYGLVTDVLRGPALDKLYAHACSIARAEAGLDDPLVPGAPAYYGNPLMEFVLERLLPRFERETGLSLTPTYSYFRVYRRGDVLPRHLDRPACEISVSLALGQAEGKPWPLGVMSRGALTTTPTPLSRSMIALTPGQALIYRGHECPHWREPFEGDGAAQLFLHYVDTNGPLAPYAFDGRSSTTAPPTDVPPELRHLGAEDIPLGAL